MTNKKWKAYETDITPYKILAKIDTQELYQKGIISIFDCLLKKFLLILNKKQGIHLFFDLDFSEAHVLFSEICSPTATNYTKITNNDLINWIKKNNLAKSLDDEGLPKIIPIEDGGPIKIIKDICPDNFSNESIKDPTILPFNFGRLNFGCFIIWGVRNENRKDQYDDIQLKGWLYSWYSCLAMFIRAIFKISENIYLPEYFTTGWKKVAVLFADIRNFTPLTEILRNRSSQMGKNGHLEEIIKKFYKEMSNIIHENRNARIDKFLGDGIMVIFGEQKSKTGEPACDAIFVAAKMIDKFNELKDEWQREVFGVNFEKEYNETVEIDLGIGIDYGSVFFELLGDENHIEYSAIGDHVNFASRLQGMAANDDGQNKKHPPIILSRTAYSCCKEWLKEIKDIKLTVKGKPYTYNCFGVNPEDLISDRFFKADDEEEKPGNASRDT